MTDDGRTADYVAPRDAMAALGEGPIASDAAEDRGYRAWVTALSRHFAFLPVEGLVGRGDVAVHSGFAAYATRLAGIAVRMTRAERGEAEASALTAGTITPRPPGGPAEPAMADEVAGAEEDVARSLRRVQDELLGKGLLPIWVIHDAGNPWSPGLHVLRLEVVGGADDVPEHGMMARGSSVAQLVRMAPAGLHRLDRDPSDQPSIVGTLL